MAAPQFVPLSRASHTGKRWRRFSDYRFAAARALVPVVAWEVAKVAVCMPMVFARGPAGYTPVALLGLESDKNLFVDEQGRWLADYTPAGLRVQPFGLGRGPGGEMAMCVDENSELALGAEGEPFFDEQGEITEDLRKIMGFLQRVEQGRAATAIACEALARHGCIAPLAFSVKDKGGKEHRMEGLYRADEAVLNKLAAEAFLELRTTGAIALAYAQLVSLQKLPLLPKLAARVPQGAAAASVAAGKDIDLSFLEKDGTFGFDAFR